MKNKWTLIGALIAITIFLASVTHHADSTSPTAPAQADAQSDAQPPAAPAAAESHVDRVAAQHDARAPLKDYWDRIHGNLSVAYIAFGMGILDVQNGDTVSGSGYFDKASKLAEDAMMDAGNNHPDGLDDISQELGTGGNELKWASEDMVKYLDSPAPSMMNDALQHAGNAKESITQATHDMRVKFSNLGGHWQDIASY